MRLWPGRSELKVMAAYRSSTSAFTTWMEKCCSNTAMRRWLKIQRRNNSEESMARSANRFTAWLLILALCMMTRIASAESTIDLAHASAGAPKEAVLFPFDNYSIPLRKGVEMKLIDSEHTRASYNPVLVQGKPGTPDSYRIGYYGTVIELNGRFHMWYIGDGDQDKIDQEKSST